MSKFWTNAVTRGDQILLRGVEDGRRFSRKIAYRPTLYEEVGGSAPYRTIYGRAVAPVEFESIGSARQALQGGADLFGYDRWNYVYLAENYPGRVEYDPSMVLVANLDIETMADAGMPDPENPDKVITAITVALGDRIHTFGCRPYVPSDPRVTYHQGIAEKDMLAAFLVFWNDPANCPDIITGWNVEFFDVPYLVNRIALVLGNAAAERLSPWGVLKEKMSFHHGAEKNFRYPLGISVLDYMRIYHKLAVMTRAVATPDDMKLNTIASIEVGEKKIDYTEYESLHDLYVNDFQKYVDYNIHDVMLVQKIDDKRQLIDLILAMAYNAKVNFDDMLGSVKPWECILHHQLLAKGVVFPRRGTQKGKALVGAFVKDSPPMSYDWVVSFDLNSLYSHLIMEWNISPETRIGRLSKSYSIDQILEGSLIPHKQELVSKQAIVAANMVLFDRRQKGYLPAILEEMYDARVVAKNNAIEAAKQYELTKDEALKRVEAKWKNMDKVHKTNLNAAYGVLTNEYFLFYDHANAEAITTSGQMAIRWVERKVNAFINKALGTVGKEYIIAMDTDSIYVNFGPFVDQKLVGRTKEQVVDFLVRMCGPTDEQAPMEKVIDDAYQELADMVNAVEQKMRMKRETIADRGIWCGAKNYILNALDEEGVRFAEPKISMKGIAAVKSSTPPSCRTKLKDAIKLIMQGDMDKVDRFIADFRQEFETLPFWEIAKTSSVSDMYKWVEETSDPLFGTVDGVSFKSGCPIQVRAAWNYNLYIRKHRLVEYPEIYDGDRIKFVYLKLPNALKQNIFGTTGPIPRELDLNKYIDREKQFEKGFLLPMRAILNAIGWTQSDTSLESFMGDVAAAEPVRLERMLREQETAGLDEFFA